MTSLLRIVCLVSAISLVAKNASAQISSDFASNDEGWTTPGDANGLITYNAAGGNPTGNVSGSPFVINLGATSIYVNFYFVAPGKFTGNRSGYYNGTLRYDIQPSSIGSGTQYAEAIITNNAGIALYYYPSTQFQPAAAPAWTTFSITLNEVSGFWKTTDSPTGAAATQAQILGILNDLARLEIRGLYRDANTTNRLDNVTLMPPIVVTTQPSASAVCSGATATFTTAATGNANITYQWERQTGPTTWVNVTSTGGYTGAGTSILSVNTTGNFGAGTYRCRISGTAVDDQYSSSASLTVNTLPGAPSVTGNSSCAAGSLTLSASGGAAGQYRWYTVAVGGTAIAGQTNATYSTPVIAATTTYYVAINNGTCQGARTAVTATINTPPVAPGTTGRTICNGSTASLSASGGSAGQYRWYTAPTGGANIAGQTNSTFVTPALSATTTYYVSVNNGTCESARAAVVATVIAVPGTPATTGNTVCSGSPASLSASGGSPGQYRWYTVSTGGTPVAGQTNSTFATPVLLATTTYYVAVNNGTCEGPRAPVTATVTAVPSVPIITDGSSCTAGSVTLSASGGSQGQYRWYTVAAGGTPIAGETNSTFITPSLSTTTVYYVSVNNGSCESARATVVAEIEPPECGNHPPAIESTPLSTQIDGIITIDLSDLVSDIDNNADLSTLSIVTPPASGASATIDNNYNLVINYKGLSFSGKESIALQVCDIFSACVQQTLSIEVVGEIVVYNAISPNNDASNPVFLIQHIEKLSDTKKNHVTIFNRWGDIVWEGANYDNNSTVFRGKSKNDQDLPTGTYFYKIEFEGGRPLQTGYLSLRR